MSDIQAMSKAKLQALSPLVNSVHMNAEDDESISPILQPTLKRKTNRNYKDLHNRYVCTPMYPLYDTMVNMKIKREKRKEKNIQECYFPTRNFIFEENLYYNLKK